MHQLLLPLDGLPPDADVQAAHDGHGREEGDDDGDDGHPLAVDKLDVALVGLDGAPTLQVGPGDDPGRPHHGGDAPRSEDHQGGLLGRAPGPEENNNVKRPAERPLLKEQQFLKWHTSILHFSNSSLSEMRVP